MRRPANTRFSRTLRWVAGGMLVGTGCLAPTAFAQSGNLEQWILTSKFMNPDVRSSAVLQLGRSGDPRALKPVLVALHDKSAQVRRSAAMALGELRDSRGIRALIDALGDPDPQVRGRAAESLGKIGDRRAVEPLIASLNDQDSSVRLKVTASLQKIADPRAVEPLIAELQSPDLRLRAAAAHALGDIRDPRAIEPLIAELRNGHWEARNDLGKIGLPAVEPLIAAIGESGPRAAGRAAAIALSQFTDPRAVDPLISELKDERWCAGGYAAFSLGKIKDRHAVGPLIEALGAHRSCSGDGAAEALGEIGDGRAVEPLIAALSDLDCHRTRSAEEALGKLKDPRAVEFLIAALSDSELEPVSRIAAAKALGEIGDPQAVEPLIAMLPDPDLSSEVIAVLGKIGDARAVPALAAMARIRPAAGSACIDALGRIGAPAVEPLISLLDEKLGSVQEGVVKALGASRDPRAVRCPYRRGRGPRFPGTASDSGRTTGRHRRSAGYSASDRALELRLQFGISSGGCPGENRSTCGGTASRGLRGWQKQIIVGGRYIGGDQGTRG